MSTLNNRDLDSLRLRGIHVESGHPEINITLSTYGVAWLFNYLDISGLVGETISLKMLKEIAQFNPSEKQWRDLRFKSVTIPVYEDTVYFQLVFYLNASPPRVFHSFDPNSEAAKLIQDILLVYPTVNGVFRVRQDQDVKIIFSKSEVEELKNGTLMSIQFLK